jgi:acyl carrier protein
LPGPSSTVDPTNPADVLADVRDLLVEVIGPEYVVGLTIEPATSLDRDLQLESLELVTLAELLMKRFGERVDLVAWLATKELDEIIDLTVGDLVDLVVTSTAPDTAAAG